MATNAPLILDTYFYSCGINIIYINVYIYIFILYIFFCLLFLYNLEHIKTINNLKVLAKHSLVGSTIVLIILSLSGMPPLLGFIGKFLLFLFLFFSQKYIYIIVFSILNFFSIYFYIQNLRFLISKSQLDFFLICGFFIFFNKKITNNISLFNLINFFGIFYFEDIYYIFSNIILYSIVW